MDDKYWQRQTTDKPLFPELLWSRPQYTKQAGKLLIVGGSQQNFSAVAEAYNQSAKAGIGSARVMLPRSLQKIVSNFFPEAIFAPATPSGSFSSSSVGEILSEADWADAVLLAGNLGNNSETAIAIEALMNKFDGPLIICGDTIDLLLPSTKILLARNNTTLIMQFSQLQHFFTAAKYKTAITSSLDFLQIISILQDFTNQNGVTLVSEFAGNIVISLKGRVSTTKAPKLPINIVSLAAYSAVWLLQNVNKPFEALSTATIEYFEIKD